MLTVWELCSPHSRIRGVTKEAQVCSWRRDPPEALGCRGDGAGQRPEIEEWLLFCGD